MGSIEILATDELALVVGATNVHGEVRRHTGMCGCGILPDPGTVHVH